LGGPNASETSTVVTNYSGIVHKVVAFNYDDPNHVSYTMNDRVATGGASMTGWAYSNGAGIDDPFQPAQHLTPPVGWPILWGDPGLAQASGTGYAYLTTLAVPQSKMPSGGQIHGSLEPYLGGACVARSHDGGVSFSVSTTDCLHTYTYDFYDGSDVAATAGGGPVFAAFRNVDRGSIDVWGAVTSTGAFAQLPNPFPGKSMASHPRLFVAGNTLFIIAADLSNNIWLQSYSGGAWGSASANWPKLVASDYYPNDLSVGGMPIRRNGGPQFDLAWLGFYSTPGDLIVVYTASGAGYSILKASICHPEQYWVGTCTTNFATMDAGQNAFHPSLGVAKRTYPGNPAYDVIAVLMWVQQVGTNVELEIAPSIVNGGAIAHWYWAGPQAPCSDQRGYWGDYDAHMGVYQATTDDVPMFWRSFTDSTQDDQSSVCDPQYRWTYTSRPVNVSAAWGFCDGVGCG